MQPSKLNIGIAGINSVLFKSFYSKYSKKYKFSLYKNDINNIKEFKKWILLNKNIDVFINFAAIVSTKACLDNKIVALKTNFKTVLDILNVYKQTNKTNITNLKYFLALSTSHVFLPSNKKLTEKSKKKPSNYYGVTKLKMENALLKKNNFFNVGIGRIFNYYNRSTKNGFFINDILNILNSKNDKIYLIDVDTYRDYIDIKDIISAISHMVDNNLKGDYNICSGKGFYLKKIVKSLNIKFKKKLCFINTYKKSIIGDNTKLKKTGWKIKHILTYKKIV